MPIPSFSQFKMSSTDKLFPIFGVSDESYALSQLKYQTLLCDEDMLTCDSMLISSSIVSNHQKNSPSPAITIINNTWGGPLGMSGRKLQWHGKMQVAFSNLYSLPRWSPLMAVPRQVSFDVNAPSEVVP